MAIAFGIYDVYMYEIKSDSSLRGVRSRLSSNFQSTSITEHFHYSFVLPSISASAMSIDSSCTAEHPTLALDLGVPGEGVSDGERTDQTSPPAKTSPPASAELPDEIQPSSPLTPAPPPSPPASPSSRTASHAPQSTTRPEHQPYPASWRPCSARSPVAPPVGRRQA